LGRAYLSTGDKSNALHCFKTLQEATPTDKDVLYDLAHLYASEQEYITALYHFKEASRHFPNNPYIHSHMAYVLFKLEDYEGAVEEYRQAIEYGDDPVWTATIAQTLGTIFYQVYGQHDEALDLFLLADELDPDNTDCKIMLGELYFEAGQLQDALDLYREVLSKDPLNAECYNYIGYLLWQLDQNDDAIAAYEQALVLDGKNSTALNNLGVIYLDEFYQADKAKVYFESALAHKPSYTLAAFNLGRAKEGLGERAEAAKAYTLAQSLNEVQQDIDPLEIQDRISQLFEM